jgi:hypothetical protein
MSKGAWAQHQVLSHLLAAGVPERLFKLLSDPHTLVHALHLAHKQLGLLEQRIGIPAGPSPVAERVAELLALHGYVQQSAFISVPPSDLICILRPQHKDQASARQAIVHCRVAFCHVFLFLYDVAHSGEVAAPGKTQASPLQ